MKAITIWQPWATLVAIGAKKIETRSWKTSYRGPLAIHAAKNFPEDAQHLCFTDPFRNILSKHGYVKLGEIYLGNHQFPLGAIIATCELVDVDQIINYMQLMDRQLNGWMDEDRYWYLTDQERAFGNFQLGRFAWLLDDVKLLPEPIPAKGRLGLWEWEENKP